jgi:hypothetical protein
MEVAIALMLVVSGYLTIRKFQWIDIYVFDYQYHRDTCIERIKQPQITCDAVCVLHSVFITLYWLGIFLLCLLHLVFKVSPSTLDVVAIVLFAINVCLYVAHLLVRRILYARHGIKAFYDDMVAYRAKQKVVTEDNDYEVSFLRTYRESDSNTLYSHFWMLISAILLALLIL